MKYVKLFEQFLNEGLGFTFADLDAENDEIKSDFKTLGKYMKYIGARTPSDAYLAGTEGELRDEGIIFNELGKPERVDVEINLGMTGTEAQMGTLKGEKAFGINDGQDVFIYVGPKSKDKFDDLY
jgi:hypothetical protein